jgi:hypothetical protein
VKSETCQALPLGVNNADKDKRGWFYDQPPFHKGELRQLSLLTRTHRYNRKKRRTIPFEDLPLIGIKPYRPEPKDLENVSLDNAVQPTWLDGNDRWSG